MTGNEGEPMENVEQQVIAESTEAAVEGGDQNNEPVVVNENA